MIGLLVFYSFQRHGNLNVVNNYAYVCFSSSGGDSGV